MSIRALKQLILLYPAHYYHSEHVYPLGTFIRRLQRYCCEIDNYMKKINNFNKSLLAKLHNDDKWLSYLNVC